MLLRNMEQIQSHDDNMLFGIETVIAFLVAFLKSNGDSIFRFSFFKKHISPKLDFWI